MPMGIGMALPEELHDEMTPAEIKRAVRMAEKLEDRMWAESQERDWLVKQRSQALTLLLGGPAVALVILAIGAYAGLARPGLIPESAWMLAIGVAVLGFLGAVVMLTEKRPGRRR